MEQEQVYDLIETEVPAGAAGTRIFRVSRGGGGDTGGGADTGAVTHGEDAETEVFYRTIPGLVTPFDLPLECFPAYEAVLNRDPSLAASVSIMMRGDIAVSTAKQYKPVVLQFRDFCSQPLSYIKKIVPALSLLETILGRKDTGLSALVRDGALAIQREMALHKPPVRKATGYSYEVVQHLLQMEVQPHLKQPYRINPFHFRSLFRAVIVFFTFCRFADFVKLTDADFRDHGSYIRVVFRVRKNDQQGENSMHVVSSRPDCAVCPLQVIRAYF